MFGLNFNHESFLIYLILLFLIESVYPHGPMENALLDFIQGH